MGLWKHEPITILPDRSFTYTQLYRPHCTRPLPVSFFLIRPWCRNAIEGIYSRRVGCRRQTENVPIRSASLFSLSTGPMTNARLFPQLQPQLSSSPPPNTAPPPHKLILLVDNCHQRKDIIWTFPSFHDARPYIHPASKSVTTPDTHMYSSCEP